MSGFIFYDDGPRAREEGRGISWEKLMRANANEAWAGHFYNLTVLSFISANEPHMHRKMQAEKEIGICRRKLAWWERHPNFEPRAARALAKRKYGITDPNEAVPEIPRRRAA